MIHGVGPGGHEPRPINYELEPAVYIERVREFYHDNADSVRSAPRTVMADMEHETAVSAAFAEEACADPTDQLVTPDDTAWAQEGFSRVMTLLVKASAKAAEQATDLQAFSGFDEAGQAAIRKQMFSEYVEACRFLAFTDIPAKHIYLSSVFLCRNINEMGILIEQNEDLGQRNVINALVRQPATVEEALDERRVKIAAAIRAFPTVGHRTIRSIVLNVPNSYEKGVRAYAEKNGLIVDVEEQPELPDAAAFLDQFRQMARARSKGLGGMSAPEEIQEVARQLSEEALAAANPEDPMYAAAYVNPEVREAYRQKVELLVKAAHNAWRFGEFPFTLLRVPEEFRAALYSRVLGDFLKIHVELDEKAPDFNRVLYYGPEEIRQLVADNPDIPPAYFRHKLPHDPSQIQASMQQFRTRVEAIRRANPRLLEYEVARKALTNAPVEETPGPEEPGDKLSPEDFIGEIRSYLNTDGDVQRAPSRQAKEEIIERLAEIEARFEASDWQFADLDIPEIFRPVLIKKIEDFILAASRTYRSGAMANALSDYDPEERMEMYGIVAENYARIVTLLGAKVVKVWKNNPALHIDAGELAELHEQHAWLHTSNFREIAIQYPSRIVATLEKALAVKTELKRLYPGLGNSVIETLIRNSPATAKDKAIDHIQKTTEGEFRRYGSVKEPDPSQPGQVYRYYRTFIRYGNMPKPEYFDPETEQGIAEVVSRASTWLRGQEEMADADEETIGKFLGHIDYCLRSGVVLKREDTAPSLLDLSDSAQTSIVRHIYKNQVDLNAMIASVANGNGSTFRFYDFGFAHEAKYMKRLWAQYEPYMAKNLVTYVALKSQYRPYRKLNELIECRANLLTRKPDATEEEIARALAAAAQV